MLCCSYSCFPSGRKAICWIARWGTIAYLRLNWLWRSLLLRHRRFYDRAFLDKDRNSPPKLGLQTCCSTIIEFCQFGYARTSTVASVDQEEDMFANGGQRYCSKICSSTVRIKVQWLKSSIPDTFLSITMQEQSGNLVGRCPRIVLVQSLWLIRCQFHRATSNRFQDRQIICESKQIKRYVHVS